MHLFLYIRFFYNQKTTNMEKTLGGDRLGSGKKQKVHLHGYGRSTHDLGYIWRSTMSAGTLVPFMSEVALPGDTFDIELDCDVKTHPTIGPLFGSYKVQLDLFAIPVRLYNNILHNNALNVGRRMKDVLLPQIRLEATALPDDTEDYDNSQINPSSILAYLGIRGIGAPETDGNTRRFNAVPILAYWDIYKNYYANKQEEIGAVIHQEDTALVETVDDLNAIVGGVTTVIPQDPTVGSVNMTTGSTFRIDFTGATPIPSQIFVNVFGWGWVNLETIMINRLVVGSTITGDYNSAAYGPFASVSRWRYATISDGYNGEPKVETFPLTDIDDMRTEILRWASAGAFLLNDMTSISPYRYLFQKDANDRAFVLNTQEGLGVKTYQSDIFNNWLSTEWIDGAGGITELTAIDTTDGSFTLDVLNISKKVYNMLNRIAVSGGSYEDWQEAVYDHEAFRKAESPIYCGGLSKELVFQEVVSNSESTGESGGQPLGTLAGKGVMGKKHKGGKCVIKIDEVSYIMGIVSLTPRIDYSQGNKWDVNLLSMDDFHKPALDEIGFQELITDQMAWWTTGVNASNEAVFQSAGKQPAWINYMTNYNKTYGNFAIKDNEMFMTLNRQYEKAGTSIQDLTTYIDPVKFNNIFAQTSLDAQNFWVQIGVDITARRKMSAKVIPNV